MQKLSLNSLVDNLIPVGFNIAFGDILELFAVKRVDYPITGYKTESATTYDMYE